jgi:hypothetical protein
MRGVFSLVHRLMAVYSTELIFHYLMAICREDLSGSAQCKRKTFAWRVTIQDWRNVRGRRR